MQIAYMVMFLFAIIWSSVRPEGIEKYMLRSTSQVDLPRRQKRWTRLEPSVRFFDRRKKWTRLEPSVRFFDKRWTRLEPSIRFLD